MLHAKKAMKAKFKIVYAIVVQIVRTTEHVQISLANILKVLQRNILEYLTRRGE